MSDIPLLPTKLFTPVPEVAEIQPVVQRRLGRCILRVQQYEFLLKKIIPILDIGGTVDSLHTNHAKRVNEISKWTLGMAVNFVKTNYVVTDADIEALDAGLREPKIDSPKANWIRHRNFHVVDEPTKIFEHQRLDSVVLLRNTLVHHLQERFQLATVPGCELAIAYLLAAHDEIDQRLQDLWRWYSEVVRTAEIGASLDIDASLDAAAKFMDRSIGTEETVVDCFKNAESQLAVSGWTYLNDAILFVKDRHPSQTPQLNERKGWKSVLKATKQFDIETRHNEETGVGKTYYRSKAFTVPAAPATQP